METKNNSEENLVPNPPTPEGEQSNAGSLQTMNQDFLHAVQDNSRTLADVALEAQARRSAGDQANPNLVRVKKRKPTQLYTILILIFLGVALVLVTFKLMNSPSEPDPFKKFAVTSVILPNEQVGVSSAEFQRGFETVMIELATQTEVQENEVVHIYFTDGEVPGRWVIDSDDPIEITDISTLFTLTSDNIPPQVSRSLDQNNYVYGIYGLPDNQRSQFLILKPKSYENAFAGMLAWEDTIVQDLQPMLQIDVADNLQYKDKLMFNKDVRTIETLRGKIVLLYSFLDTNTIVIATDKDVFREVMARVFQTPNI